MAYTDIIKSYVQVLKNTTNTDYFINLKNTNYEMYENELRNLVPKFYDGYPFLFRKIIKGEDDNFLNIMLSNINDIENGEKTLDNVRDYLGNLLHNHYVADNLPS